MYFNCPSREANLRRKYFKSTVVLLMTALLFTSSVLGQSEYEFLFDTLTSESSTNQKEIVDKLLTILSDLEPSIAEKQTERLLKLTVKFSDLYCYNIVLLFSTRFGTIDERKNKLRASINLADDRDDLNLKAKAFISLSEIYQEEVRYDSVIVMILKARDIFRNTKNLDEEVTLLQKLGDIYFVASLFDKAEYYYNEVLKLKGDPSQWFLWRKFVITNNFGLIERERKNYDKAIYYFKKALDEMLSDKKFIMSYSDTSRLIYSHTNLARFYLSKKDYYNTWVHINTAHKLESNYNDPSSLVQIFLIKGMFYFHKSIHDSSIYFLKKAESLIESPSVFQLSTTINKYLADNYAALKDYKSAWIASDKVMVNYDSILKRRKTFEAIKLITEDQIAQSESKIKSFEIRQNVYLGIILLVLLSMILTLLLYLRLNGAHKLLIRKNLELLQAENKSLKIKSQLDKQVKESKNQTMINSSKNHNHLTSEYNQEPLDPVMLQQIDSHLEEVMYKKQLFLDANLNLDTLAQLLGTNRNYLSKVINQVHGVHFNTYLNNLRIRRAIHILSNRQNTEVFNLEGIAREVGFTNRITFLSAFKKYTGVTPSYFIKNLPDA